MRTLDPSSPMGEIRKHFLGAAPEFMQPIITDVVGARGVLVLKWQHDSWGPPTEVSRDRWLQGASARKPTRAEDERLRGSRDVRPAREPTPAQVSGDSADTIQHNRADLLTRHRRDQSVTNPVLSDAQASAFATVRPPTPMAQNSSPWPSLSR